MTSAYGNWGDVNTLVALVVQYYTGNTTIFAFLVAVIFLMILVVRGVPFSYASVFTLPVLAGFIALGYISTNWILGVALIIVAFFYAKAILKMMAS